MTARPLLIALLVSTVACVTGCTTAYRNGQLCKNKMIDSYPSTEPELSVDVPRVAYKGARVVAGGTFKESTDSLVAKVGKKETTFTVETREVATDAAVECTFDGDKLETFRWLTPAKFSAVYDDVKPDE